MPRATRIALGVLGLTVAVLAVGPFLVPIPPLEGTVPPEALADPDSRFVEIAGLQVHYRETGQGEPAVLLLHGFGASTFSWREVMEPLGRGYHVVAFDRPGFGLTARPLPGEWTGRSPYSTEAQVDLTVALMDALGVERAVLVGNSAGGTIALLVALAYPARVRGLVLVDAAIYTRGGAPAWLRPILAMPQMRRLGPLLLRAFPKQGEDLIRLAWHDPSKVTPEVLEGYRKPLQAAYWDRALYELTVATAVPDLAPRLPEVRVPTLVVTGDDDRIVPTEESLRLAAELPNARLVVIPACGHLPQEECPGPFLKAVKAFLEGLGGAGGAPARPASSGG